MKGATPGAVRAQLGRFGFSGDKATTQVGKLSGGERARLALALITRDAPHMLILDEPTNHLDVDAREALVQALNAYTGRGRRRQPRPPHAGDDRRPAGAGRWRHRDANSTAASTIISTSSCAGDNGPAAKAARKGRQEGRAPRSPPRRASRARRCARRHRQPKRAGEADQPTQRRSIARCSIRPRATPRLRSSP